MSERVLRVLCWVLMVWNLLSWILLGNVLSLGVGIILIGYLFGSREVAK